MPEDPSRQQLDGAAYILRGVVTGLFNSGWVRPLLLLGALSSVLQRFTNEYLQLEWARGGRAGYEDAKKAILELNTMARSDLDAFVLQMNQSITETELQSGQLDDTVPPGKPN